MSERKGVRYGGVSERNGVKEEVCQIVRIHKVTMSESEGDIEEVRQGGSVTQMIVVRELEWR